MLLSFAAWRFTHRYSCASFQRHIRSREKDLADASMRDETQNMKYKEVFPRSSAAVAQPLNPDELSNEWTGGGLRARGG